MVIAPKKVAEDTWFREADKWDHLNNIRISAVLGTPKQRLKALEAVADVYIVSRDNVVWLVEHYGKRWPFDMVVVDELSSFKNPQAKRFRALRKVRAFIDRFVGLTGSPSPNSILDLWAQMYLIDMGQRLGRTIGIYRDTYFTIGAHNGYVVYEYRPKPMAVENINKLISDVCISMSAKDYLELPERIDNVVPVRFTDREMTVYKQMETEQLIELDGQDVVALSAAAVMNKLLQLSNGAVYDAEGKVAYFSDTKLERLKEIIDATADPVLIFYSFRHDADRIREAIPQARDADGPDTFKEWNEGKIKVLLAHPASVGYGLNLQDGGSTICWYGLPWSLEWYMQANARLQRQGQTKTVIIHHLITEGTVDEQVYKALQRKDVNQKSLLEALKERS